MMGRLLSLVPQAYHISKHTSTQVTHSPLVYEEEKMIHIEVIVLLARLALTSKILDPNEGIYDVESSRRRD